MVSGAFGRPPAAPRVGFWRRFGQALAHGFSALPALLAALFWLRVAELGQGMANGLGSMALLWYSFLSDFAALLRYSWLALLLALPFLFISSARLRNALVALPWTLVVLTQAALMHYRIVAGVPLGADLLAYSPGEIATTARGGMSLGLPLMLGLAASLLCLWLGLFFVARIKEARMPPLLAGGVAAFSMALGLALPADLTPPASLGHSAGLLSMDKTSFLLDDLRANFTRHLARQATATKLPDYPFLGPERTPDTLGPLLEPDFQPNPATPPNIVLIVVEGLGRSFSGPQARLGSFTPFLDRLIRRSLYWENFLATQGRTFGVLPSLLGSLPFGERGFSEREPLAAHASLASILKAQGYQTRFYTGSNLDFDNEGRYLKAAGIDSLTSERDFAPPAQRINDWGYADRDLFELVSQREAAAAPGPFFTLVQTTTMHTPYTFPGMEQYYGKVEKRLAELEIPAAAREPYRAQREIYASILYTDDALRAFFEHAEKQPTHANTIYIITGDHRLPELPMDTRLERYHVPLIVYAPMLQGGRSMKAMASHFDVTPALLALLSHRWGLKTPAQPAWLGSGLDTDLAFRNEHAFPLKQTKIEMNDYISGIAYLGQDRLYQIADGLQIEPYDNDKVLAAVRAQFSTFLAANARFENGAALVPDAAVFAPTLAYAEAGRTLRHGELALEPSVLGVSGMEVRVEGMAVIASADFTNRGRVKSPVFVPLLVLADEKGKEDAEASEKAMTLEAGQSARVSVRLQLKAAAGPRRFVSLIVTHPDTGKAIGGGQYHVPLPAPEAAK